MGLHEIARALHIVGGTVGLATFWLPLVTRKGGRLHRRVGWIYVMAMLVAAFSGTTRLIDNMPLVIGTAATSPRGQD